MKKSSLVQNKNKENTSLAAQGALAHRLQRRPKPIHNNAKSGARLNSLPPGGFGPSIAKDTFSFEEPLYKTSTRQQGKKW